MKQLARFDFSYYLNQWYISLFVVFYVLMGIALHITTFNIEHQVTSKDILEGALVLNGLICFILFALPFLKNRKTAGLYYIRLSYLLPVKSKLFVSFKYLEIFFLSLASAFVPIMAYVIFTLFSSTSIIASTLIMITLTTLSPFILYASLYIFCFFCLPYSDFITMIIYLPSMFLPIAMTRIPAVSTFVSSNNFKFLAIFVFITTYLLSLVFGSTRSQRVEGF